MPDGWEEIKKGYTPYWEKKKKEENAFDFTERVGEVLSEIPKVFDAGSEVNELARNLSPSVFGINPTDVLNATIGGIQGAVEKFSGGTEAIDKGDVWGGLSSYLLGGVTGGFGLLAPLAPVAAYTTAMSELERSKIPALQKGVELFGAPVTKSAEFLGKDKEHVGIPIPFSSTVVQVPKTLVVENILETADVGTQLAVLSGAGKGVRAVKTKKGTRFQDNKTGKFLKKEEVANRLKKEKIESPKEQNEFTLKEQETKPLKDVTQEKLPTELVKQKIDVTKQTKDLLSLEELKQETKPKIVEGKEYAVKIINPEGKPEIFVGEGKNHKPALEKARDKYGAEFIDKTVIENEFVAGIMEGNKFTEQRRTVPKGGEKVETPKSEGKVSGVSVSKAGETPKPPKFQNKKVETLYDEIMGELPEHIKKDIKVESIKEGKFPLENQGEGGRTDIGRGDTHNIILELGEKNLKETLRHELLHSYILKHPELTKGKGYFGHERAIKELETKIKQPLTPKSEQSPKVETTAQRLKREALEEGMTEAEFKTVLNKLPFEKKRTIIEKKITESKKKRIDALNNNNSFADPTVFAESVKIGALRFQQGVVKFADWSKQMVKDLGEKIKPQLLKIWSQVKNVAKELGETAFNKVEGFLESRFNPTRPFKMMGDELAPRKLSFTLKETKETSSIKNEIVNKERTQRGLEPLQSKFVQEWGDVGKDALNKLETGKIDPNRLAQELVDKPRPHTSTEAAILNYEKLRIKEARSDINKKLSENYSEELYKEALKLDELYHTNELATNLSGTEVARALNIRKMELQDDYSVAPLLNRARLANNDRPLPQPIKAKLEKSSLKIEQKTEKVRDLEEDVTKRVAEEYVEELTVRETRQRKRTKRVKSQQSLETEYNDLIKEFAEASQFNLLFDPKQLKIISLMVKNRVQKGVTSVDNIVDVLHESLSPHVKDATKRDFLDAIGGYGKYTKLSKGEINATLRDIKRQARLLSALDDVKTKQQRPLKSGVEREALSNRVKELQRQLKIEMDKLGLGGGLSETSLKKAYETRLRNRRAELQEMLRTGNYTKKTRRRVELDDNLRKLKDEVDVLKIGVDKEIYLLEQANKTKWEKSKELVTEIANIPKSIKSAYDLSAPFRQGAFALINHPIVGFKKGGAFRQMFKYASGDKFMRELKREINDSPNLSLIDKSGLFLASRKSTLGRVLGKEEAFQSHIPEKIPILKHGIKFSERGYVGFLDKLRFDLFNYKVEQLRRSGYTFENRPDLYKATAKLINIATGRGTLGGFERAARVLSLGFFSPRLVASRLQILSPGTYLKLPKELRVSAMLDLVRFTGVGTTIGMLGKMAGAEVSGDPTSTDFMKIKIGNTRIDPWAGLQQPVVLVGRGIMGETTSPSGKTTKLDGSEFPFTSRWELLLRFAETKMSPTAGMIKNFLKNETFMGEDLTATNIAADLLMPLYLNDLYEAYKIDGMQGAMITSPAFFGMGAQTFETGTSGTRRTTRNTRTSNRR